MLSHLALLVIITTIKNNSLCSYSLAKYKLSEQTSYTISWKYFFSTNGLSRLFTPNDLMLISGRFVIKNSKQCMTIAYTTIFYNGYTNYEFKFIDVLICIPYYMFSILVNQYNSITGFTNVKIEITVFYSSKSIKFKHLEFLGSNIKVENTYLISGFFKFSNSDKMIIEATDIDYSRPLPLNFNISKNFSNTLSNTRLIIDIIADDIDSITDQSSKESFIEHDTIVTSNSSKILSSLTIADDKPNSLFEKKNNMELDTEYDKNENNQKEDNQPKKRRRNMKK
ncbi:661_t:CDS:2 [Scutellospora calospora]|uniref:661_t:CDS:1 n=1 Tax=Scutellospora calospora TaxID=85575 RepID=A0ACA9K8B8_9GLOM|nr:661_t:CDS:2 [Scutellospora calospora]